MSTKSHINPFRVGTEIRDPENFAGRKEILKSISDAISNLQNVSLHGERRTGKTSLLLYLAYSDTFSKLGISQIHIPVYFNFQGLAEADALRVWQAIADTTAKQIKNRAPDGQVESDKFLTTIAQLSREPELFVTGLGQALARLHDADLKIHLLFDEFDQTVNNPNLGDFFYDALRSLPTRAGNISYIIATRTEGLAALQPKYDKVSSPFFNIFTTLTLRPFKEEEVHELISTYFDRAGLSSSLSMKLCAQLPFLHKVTGYHPHFLQTLCYHLYARSGKPNWPLGQAQQEALEAFEKDSVSNFKYYWEVSSKEERKLMAELTVSQPVPWNRLGYGAASLRDRCLIVQTESGWQMFSSVFTEWITNTLDKADTKEADQLFGFGEKKFRQHDWEGAIRYFRDALEENPGHLRAQLYLGNALLEQNQIEEAVAELERAYKLSPEEAHSPLVHALVIYAKEQRQAGNEDGTLNACERVLQISPDEHQAQEIRTAIWIQRRDVALEQNELDRALDAHQQADVEIGIEALNFFQRVLEIDPYHPRALLRIGEVLMGLGQTDQAIVKLEQAYELDQKEARQLLTRALTAQTQVACEANDWITVLDLCARMMQIDRTTPDIPRIIEQAIEGLRLENAEESTPGISRQQLGEILSAAENHVRLLGVVALDPDWHTLAEKWAAQLKNSVGFEITVLCESDNHLFSKAFTCDTDAVENRHSFRELQFIRDRAIVDFPEFLLEAGISKENKKVKIELMHLPIPLSVIQVDDRLFANLWLHEASNYFENITQHHRWYKLTKNYISMYLDSAYGRKYSCHPSDEILTLFDHNRIPRGIYPRNSFYDTDYSQLVVWALVFDRQGRLLIHRRADNAKDNQGMWDKSVGGHYDLTDVDTSRAVPREVIEELYRDEIKESKADFTVQAVSDKDMIYLGEWRSDQRRRHSFNEIRALKSEWVFFKLRDSQQLYSPRTLPTGGLRRLRVIADVFLFVAGPQLTDDALGDLKNSVFKLIELSELKDAMDKAIRGDEVPDFDRNKPVPKFSPDLTNIMTGELRDMLEQFSQYIKRYIKLST